MSNRPNYSIIQLKAYSTSELARLYGVSCRTLKKWILLHEIDVGRRVGRFYTISQVKTIFEKLGWPSLHDEK